MSGVSSTEKRANAWLLPGQANVDKPAYLIYCGLHPQGAELVEQFERQRRVVDCWVVGPDEETLAALLRRSTHHRAVDRDVASYAGRRYINLNQ